MGSISERLSERLLQREIIKEEELDLYRYGIECFGMKACHVITYLIIGLCFHRVMEVLVFLAAFIPIRIYAGGYHAKTPLKCYVVSCCAVVSVLFVIQFVPSFFIQNNTIGAVVAGILLIVIAPVQSANKPLDEAERIHYKYMTGLMVMIVLCTAIIFRIFLSDYISFILTLSLVYELGVAIIGKVLSE
jgi:Membrane protein putatively involved in post-translational modification of the autoinducing quorum-sensing peptide